MRTLYKLQLIIMHHLLVLLLIILTPISKVYKKFTSALLELFDVNHSESHLPQEIN